MKVPPTETTRLKSTPCSIAAPSFRTATAQEKKTAMSRRHSCLHTDDHSTGTRPASPTQAHLTLCTSPSAVASPAQLCLASALVHHRANRNTVTSHEIASPLHTADKHTDTPQTWTGHPPWRTPMTSQHPMGTCAAAAHSWAHGRMCTPHR